MVEGKGMAEKAEAYRMNDIRILHRITIKCCFLAHQSLQAKLKNWWMQMHGRGEPTLERFRNIF